MSETYSHTPGPWKVCPNEPENNRNFIQCLHVVDANGETVVRVSNGTHASANEREKHIARLIAAAPELLEQLINVRDAFREGEPNALPLVMMSVDAAISKAEGGKE